MRRGRDVRPLARTRGLIVQELGEETLVYDLESHDAHCLNRLASLVWRSCDGRTPVHRIARRLGAVEASLTEGVVRLALRRLERKRLLEDTLPDARRLPRREALRQLQRGGVAIALPLITSIVALTPAQAATCVPCGSPCNILTDTCCAGCSCGVVSGTCDP
jgi:hypothetical protein